MIFTENEGTVNSHKIFAAVAGIVCGALALCAQSGNELASCAAAPAPPFCRAVRGDRAGGWLSQSRSEVMAPHGMVAASQPLAAQAGLRILSQGGNAMLPPPRRGPQRRRTDDGWRGRRSLRHHLRGEVNTLYALNASGTAPSGATIARFAEPVITPIPRAGRPECQREAFTAWSPAPSGAGCGPQAPVRARSREARARDRPRGEQFPVPKDRRRLTPSQRCHAVAASHDRLADNLVSTAGLRGPALRNPDLAKTFKRCSSGD